MQKFRQDQFVNFVTAFDIDKNGIHNDMAMYHLMNLAKILIYQSFDQFRPAKIQNKAKFANSFTCRIKLICIKAECRS